MKTSLILLIVLFATSSANAQVLVLRPPDIESRIVEDTLRRGDPKCVHSLFEISKPRSTWGIVQVCGVLHDERGCPDTWPKEDLLCEKCGMRILRSTLYEFTQAHWDRIRAEQERDLKAEELRKKWGIQ